MTQNKTTKSNLPLKINCLVRIIIVTFVWLIFYFLLKNIGDASKMFQKIAMGSIVASSFLWFYNMFFFLWDLLQKYKSFIKITVNKKNLSLTPEDFGNFCDGLCLVYEVFAKGRKLEDKLYIDEIIQTNGKLILKLKCKYAVEFVNYLDSRIKDLTAGISIKDQLNAFRSVMKIMN